jgi:hypothetical protein
MISVDERSGHTVRPFLRSRNSRPGRTSSVVSFSTFRFADGNPDGVTGNALFHLLASLFAVEVGPASSCQKYMPVDEIRQLRSQGLSVAEIASQTGTTLAVVRRVVGKLDPQTVADRRRHQEETARRIDAELVLWSEKAKRWTAETGQSAATFWRVLKRRAERLDKCVELTANFVGALPPK